MHCSWLILYSVRTSFQQRMQSSMPQAESFQKTWLSDPSTYPIIVILAGAVTGCTAFATNKFATDGNVRVSSKTKGKVIRTW